MEIDFLSLLKQYLFISFLLINSVISSPEEAQLYDDLLKDYNVYERPVSDARENVTVSVGLVLQQIVDVVIFNFICY